MGRVGLSRLLTSGLLIILVALFSLSSLGVSALVYKFLWRAGATELEAVVVPIENFHRVRAERGDARPDWRDRRFQRGAGMAQRGWRRFTQGRGELFFLEGNKIALGSEEADLLAWQGALEELSEGLHKVQVEDSEWQLLIRRLAGEDYDGVAVARPWTPSVRVVKALFGYQLFALVLVFLLAWFVVRRLSEVITEPLAELADWSEKVGEDRPASLKDSNITEVKALQDSFTRMSARVDEALVAQRRFVADASHELKTPLTAIKGMLELLDSRPGMEEEDRSKALRVASQESNRMSALVSDLLVLSRAEAKGSGERAIQPLAPIIEEQLSTLSLIFPEQEFRQDLSPNCTWKVNREAFARIVRNLVENAAQYGGGKPIDVRLSESLDETRLEIRDRGPGLTEAQRTVVFERFARADAGRARNDGGFGLGLSIVKALVEESEGTICCTEAEGGGAVFSVLFRKP